ncbi:MAG: alpha/beta fold hydrolase [Elusimicrobia bacterium]|nr:alpha/beta fold hydrolase [Elusimicrobiota bacterium]
MKKSVSLFLLSLFFASQAWAERFAIHVEDAVPGDSLILVGDYNSPQKSNAPVLILLHGLGSARGEWAALVRAAGRRGWGTLAYDARGHGESRSTAHGNSIDYQNPAYGRNPAFWRGMIGDLAKAAETLRLQKNVSPGRFVFVGASLGANVALNAAVNSPGPMAVKGRQTTPPLARGLEPRASTAEVDPRAKPGAPAAVVALSPGMNYAGVGTENAARRWKGPLLLVAARPDAYAFQSVHTLKDIAAHPRTQVFALEAAGPQGAHGTQLFDGKLEEEILDWIGRQTASR